MRPRRQPADRRLRRAPPRAGDQRLPGVPHRTARLLFHFGDPFHVRADAHAAWSALPRAALLGPRRRRYWQSAGPVIDWFLVQLSPLGCRRLLGAPLGHWWDVDVDLSTLWGPLANTLHAELARDTDFDARRRLVHAHLGPLALDPGGDAAICRLARQAREGIVGRPAEMARMVGIGERRLRQRFALEYGWTPKAYLGLIRFNRQMLQTHPLHRQPDDPPLDHADQSHAIHEFRRYSGMTPGAYARIKAAGDPLVVTGAPEPVMPCPRVDAAASS